METIRQAAVAGLFYPETGKDLGRAVRSLMAHAHANPLASKALIAPHAGYEYSGPVAASAYASLVPQASKIRRVVLLGPCHRVALRGLALPASDAFATPLGAVPLDHEATRVIADLPQVTVSVAAHAQEHALEVQLPFLQELLGDFSLVPLVVGQATAEEVAEVLDRLWGGEETLVVVSSDLSHYLPYAKAQVMDRATVHDILSLHPLDSYEQACGGAPINGLLLVAARRGLEPHLLDLRNSGDTSGDHGRVVGYAAFAFTEPECP
ncbi:MAG: AmmeMemoRadiSam system protein B [Betaproteobacteria bacterium]|nr:AmmeMemoRadiSam system protein B [Betaproteobacteria bacterium]